MAAVDLAALLGAAVRAAVLARAPRRTVQAVAAAVTGVLVRPAAAASPRRWQEPPEDDKGSKQGDACDGASAEELLQALRQARAARRRKKKQSRRLRKAHGTAEAAAAGGGKMEAEDAEEAKERAHSDSFSSPARRNVQFDEPAINVPHAGTAKEPKVLEDLDPEIPEDFLLLVKEVNERQGTQFEAAHFTTEEEREIIASAAIFRQPIAEAMQPSVASELAEERDLPPGSPLKAYERSSDCSQAKPSGSATGSKPYGPIRGARPLKGKSN
jgi:hypothetical protein